MKVTVFYLLMPQKIYHFEGKSSEIKPPYPLCLGNVSEGFTANNIKKQD